MLKKPNDLQVREAIEAIFNVQTGDFGTNQFDTEIRNRELLHQWSLSRVERLTFRSEQLPSVILKVASPPLFGEVNLYLKVFGENSRWTPTLYGYRKVNDELWMFFEDLGTHTLKNEPSLENLQRAITALASFHVTYIHDVSSGGLQKSSQLPIFNYAAYIALAQETFKLTKALSVGGAYTLVDSRKLSQLEALVNTYDRVAIGLMSAPQTLVHGDYNADNVIFRPESKTNYNNHHNHNNSSNENEPFYNRAYIIDWANAFIGASLIDLVDLVNFGLGRFGPEIMPKILTDYRQAWQIVSGEQLPHEPLEELFVCSQIHKKMSMINWFDRCAIKWIPTGVQAYNNLVAGLIEEAYSLSTVLL